jgi:hypothetical protein
MRRPQLFSAAYWFTRHESGYELSAAEMREWDRWIAESGNRAEYDALYSTQWELKALPRPTLPTDEELCKDRSMPGDTDDKLQPGRPPGS